MPNTELLPDWASADTRASLTRDWAVHIGRILLDDDGAAGWSWDKNAQLRAHELQLVRAVATALPRGRAWSPHGVAAALCDALDLHGAAFAIADRLRDSKTPIEQSAKLPLAASERP